jgi:hypothetical protein
VETIRAASRPAPHPSQRPGCHPQESSWRPHHLLVRSAARFLLIGADASPFACRSFILKNDSLPRQAWDTHNESSPKHPFRSPLTAFNETALVDSTKGWRYDTLIDRTTLPLLYTHRTPSSLSYALHSSLDVRMRITIIAAGVMTTLAGARFLASSLDSSHSSSVRTKPTHLTLLLCFRPITTNTPVPNIPTATPPCACDLCRYLTMMYWRLG